MNSILNDKEFWEKVRAYRRDFHKFAEVKWTEFRTASIVAEKLRSMGIEPLLGNVISTPGMQFAYPDATSRAHEIGRAILQGGDASTIAQMEGLSGVVGVIDSGKPGPVIAFRFDIDALPTIESSSQYHKPKIEGFRSVNEGYCHACGHDGHTAIGLGFAEVLISQKTSLTGKIKLIFQPAEEGGGGARGIVAKGILDDVDFFFAIHLGLTKIDGLPLGNHGLICGVKDFLDSRRYDFRFKGMAAHSAGDPHIGRNSLLASCQATIGIHNIAPHSEGLMRLNVGVLNAGITRNAIPDNAYMQVDIRAENDTVGEYAEHKVFSVVKGASLMYENDVESILIGRTCSAASDDQAMELVQKSAESVEWFSDIHFLGSMGGTDDASEMLRWVQNRGGIGSYIGLGTDFAAGFHNGAFDFDESVMIPAIGLLEAIATSVRQYC